MPRLRIVLCALVALVALRFAIVVTWHKTGGDGLQYYRLAQELRTNHTFAFEADQPTYSRLPGYPLFLAYVVAPGHPISIGRHVRGATIANVVLDLLSALLLWRTALRLKLRSPKLAGVVFLGLPTLWLMSCYAMTETLSTTAVAAELYFAVRIIDEPRLPLAVAVGVVAGLAQLARLDALCALPMIVYACLRAPASPSRRAGLVAVFALSAAIVFAPWPLRNVARFGKPHFAASTSRTTEKGVPFGDGLYQWARTWSSGADAYFELYFVYGMPYDIQRPGAVPANSYDSDGEKKQLIAALGRYNVEGLSDGVNQAFIELAHARFKRHPWRTLFVLPLVRIGRVLGGEPEYDMPMEVRWLGLPFWRPAFVLFDSALLVLALAGLVVAWRRQRTLFWLVVPAVVLRVGLYAFAVPHAATHRFLVEAFPLLIISAAVAWSARQDGTWAYSSLIPSGSAKKTA